MLYIMYLKWNLASVSECLKVTETLFSKNKKRIRAAVDEVLTKRVKSINFILEN